MHTEDYIMSNLQVLNDASATQVTTRYFMYLPSRYAVAFLDSHGYTLKQVWETLIPMLAQNNDQVTCGPLVKWLRVASHGTDAHNQQGQAITGPPISAITLMSPAAYKGLIAHRALALKLSFTWNWAAN